MLNAILPRSFFPLGAALAAIGLVTGCSVDSSTTGDEGRAEFSWGTQCFLDCTLDHPMAVGSTEALIIDRADVHQVESSDTAVATFSNMEVSCSCTRSSGSESESYGPVAESEPCSEGYEKSCSTRIQAHGLAQGDVKLTLLDAEGKLIDRTTVQVRDAVSAAIHIMEDDDHRELDQLALTVGSQRNVVAVFRDDAGRELLTSAGVTWSSDDPSLVTAELGAGWFNWSPGSDGEISAKAPGSAVVRAKMGECEATLPVVSE